MSIIVDKISHVYEAGTGFERKALAHSGGTAAGQQESTYLKAGRQL